MVERGRVDPEPVRRLERPRALRGVRAAGESQEHDTRDQHARVADESPAVLGAKPEGYVRVKSVQPVRQADRIERVVDQGRPLQCGDARPQRIGARRVGRDDATGRRGDQEGLAKMAKHLHESLELSPALRRIGRHGYQLIDVRRAINPDSRTPRYGALVRLSTE